ncbi:class I adenylate-forming enzyme family protein [Actinosynnema sp. NPDC050436]|uniref:class I adenylate-forming enzyme family protein n=1 Tax=Actinosynnema sp. NPDC050436 TaxID=3155659 RepID=UPI0033D94EE7
MTHDTDARPDPAALPPFLRDYAPTWGRKRLTPLSRVPATAHLGDLWQVAGERGGDQLVITDRPADIDPTGATERTYAGWAALVDQTAAWLYSAGVREWDRVAIMKSNHLDVALLACAAARLGAVPAELAWTHPPEFAHPMLERLDQPFLITDQERLVQCGLDPEVLARLVKRTVVVDGRGERTDVVALDDLRGATAFKVALRALEEPMVITHTSGTTGVPKLVMHSAETAHALTLIEAERWPKFGLKSSDVVGFCDPFCHQRLTTGMLAMATVTPRMIMLSDPQSEQSRQLLVRHKPTVMETLPNIYLYWEQFARSPERPFANVRVFINSFDAIHTRTIRTFLDATDQSSPIWVQSWSQSEAGALVIRPYTRKAVREVGHRPPPTQVLGWPIPGLCKARAVDPETGREVPSGTVGLIEIKQPGRCLAYVGEQDRHDLKRTDDFWWNTGDLGTVSGKGAVRLVDREIDRIPGASALELEDVLLDRLPQTTEVVVLPNGDGLPVPVLSTDDDTPVDPEQWAKATEDLPKLAEPIHVRWSDFPRTATWKIRRVQLREQLLDGAKAIGIGRWT